MGCIKCFISLLLFLRASPFLSSQFLNNQRKIILFYLAYLFMAFIAFLLLLTLAFMDDTQS